jgi:hypothetical protein
MSTISTSGISIGQIIKSEHLLRIIRALDGGAVNDIVISGSLTVEEPATFNNGITGSLWGGSLFTSNVIVTNDTSTDVDRYITFVSNTNSTPQSLLGDSDRLVYRPSTDTIFATSSFAVTSSITLAVSGTNNYIPRFSGSTNITNSDIVVKGPQVQINPETTLEDSAILQIDSTDRGVLFPRMTSTQRNNISNPAEGLIVWDTTLRQLCIRVSTSWYTFDLTII